MLGLRGGDRFTTVQAPPNGEEKRALLAGQRGIWHQLFADLIRKMPGSRPILLLIVFQALNLFE